MPWQPFAPTVTTAGGDLTGTYPNPALAAAGTAGTYTKVTTDSKGRVTSGTTLASSDMPAGSVVQVAQRSNTAAQSWASNAFPNANYTDCYCYITPKFASSTILIMVSACTFAEPISPSDVGYGAGLYSSVLGTLEAHGHIGNQYDASIGGVNCTLVGWASPNSTANQYFQLTLEPYSNNGGTRIYMNRNYQGTDLSRMVLMEIRA